MKELRVVTAAEMERLSPDERARLLNDRVVTDLSLLRPDEAVDLIGIELDAS